MTIKTKIETELKRLSEEKAEILSVAEDLNKKFDELIVQVKDHLSEISREMPKYDKHDASHSEAVLEMIEQLLQEQGVGKLTLLEAVLLRFCCYFHDTGMILPAFCLPLLEQVEADPKADPRDGLVAWLKEQERDHEDVKGLFLLPGTQREYRDFLIRELVAYRDARLGLQPRPENVEPQAYIQQTRHDYLRKKHADRSKTYAMNLSRFFAEVIHGSEADLAETIGNVCAAHGWKIEQVRKLPTKKELMMNCPELTCNVRYLAMLLRLGDLLHFGPARASRTLYLERSKMDQKSDLHWLAKQGTRGYRISSTPGGVDIAYHGSFDKPKEYYFVQDHMNWVDRELTCYEAFRRQMEKQHELRQYDLGLPEKVNREHATARGFEPDRDLKFRLEHRNIIELLMGARLYRDEFMCLRELYQNALDACRCMRAERPGLEPEIEFGLGNDDGGDYLYCRDQGTGMTMDIVKNYLLRIGNSYYKSEEFRRKNAHWGDAVAPVSEFGIGLLSCYMIADRIDVITRHYTAVEEEKPIWISMSDRDDFGYRLETDWFQEEELGKHGTLVKLYLKEEYKDKVTGHIPENPEDVEVLRKYCEKKDNEKLNRITNTLYSRIQQFVYIPDKHVRVFVAGDTGRLPLVRFDSLYDINAKMPLMVSYGVKFGKIIGYHSTDYRMLFGRKVNNGESSTFAADLIKWRNCFAFYSCSVEDVENRAVATAYIHLPVDTEVEYSTDLIRGMDFAGFGDCAGITIDGMPALRKNDYVEEWNEGIHYQFWGVTRPRLTVDRGTIRSIPNEVFDLQNRLNVQLQGKLLTRIRDHFSQYPEAMTDTGKHYLVYYLCEKFGQLFATELLKNLSMDVLRDYRYYGTTMNAWFHNEIINIDADCMLEKHQYGIQMIAHRIIRTAEDVGIEKRNIQIRRNAILENRTAAGDRFCPSIREYAIKSDNWTEDYVQYDAVRDYAGFVPQHVFSLIDETVSYDFFREEIMRANNETDRLRLADGTILCAYSIGYADPVRMDYLKWEDVAALLRNGGGNLVVSQNTSAVPFAETGNKRYVLYVFINPRPVEEKDKAFVDEHKHIPKYLECVEKGWSILFYNYKNGYVIAPGIVDRMEMLKLLPREALEHDDGLEYYFTDGTKAF